MPPGLLQFLLLGKKKTFKALNGWTSTEMIPFMKKGECSSFFIVQTPLSEELRTKS